MTQQMLEILIGKYLDGQITPGEQRMLQAELDSNPEAKELFTQLEDLYERTRGVIASEILERGKPADEIFERAWQQKAKVPVLRVIKSSGWLRFAAGLAAGLIIGLALHFALVMQSSAPPGTTHPIEIVQQTDKQPDVYEGVLPMLTSDPTQNVIRNVDWYSFTDEDGTEWVVEGLRENIVRPAVYRPDL